jgi:hypothetical protein
MLLVLAVTWTGLSGAPAHAAGPSAVTITATGTITADLGSYPGLVGKAFTVYISFPAALLHNNCNLATYCSATTSATMILDIAGEPEVIPSDYGGVYRLSPDAIGSLIAESGSFIDVYGKITWITSRSLFNPGDTFFQNLSHTLDPRTESGNLQVAAVRFPGGIVGTIATITVNTQENITADFYGNGISDVLWQNIDGQVAIWQMNGTTPIAEKLAGPNSGPSWHVIATGDFNSDNYSDILFQNQSGEIAIWEMNGTSVIGGGSLGNPGPSWHVIATGDFNHDGYSDILFQNQSGEVAIWEMNGTSVIGGGSLGNPGPSWHVIATGDFNHDGYSDILFQNQSGEVAIWEINGTSVIGGGSLGNPGPSWQVIATGNFYGDGYSDVLFQNTNGGVAIWKLNGATVIGSGNPGNPGPSWHIIGQ